MSDRAPAFDFGEEAGEAEGSTYERLRVNLQKLVTDFADENEMSSGFLAMLLLDLGVSSHVVHYVTTVDKPSVGGLKLELDRLRREIDEMVRAFKKDAETILAATKQAMAEADLEFDAP